MSKLASYRNPSKAPRTIKGTMERITHESDKKHLNAVNRVTEFNRLHSVGTLVRWNNGHETGQGFTTHAATVFRGVVASVRVAGQIVPVLLDQIVSTDGEMDCEADE